MTQKSRRFSRKEIKTYVDEFLIGGAFKCTACYHGADEHDELTGRCLFNPGTSYNNQYGGPWQYVKHSATTLAEIKRKAPKAK